jgi:membrane-associated phospholipid phosphatase
MSLYSTTQPPYATKFFPEDILSTTQPPSSTQSRLVGMTTGHGLVGLMKRGLKALRSSGLPHLPTPTKPTPPMPPSWSLNSDVVGLLASDELLEKVSVAATHWSSVSGVPPAAVEFSFNSAPGAALRWVHNLPAHTAPAYTASVAAVTATMAGAAPHFEDISFQAPEPAILMALALGMDKDAGSGSYGYAYTALLIDVVVEVVTPPTHRLKKLIQVPRPHDASWGPSAAPPPKPLPEPGYTAYPSGHGTVCAALMVVLASLGANHSKKAQLKSLAQEIGLNRERAGLHTSIDTTDGIALGEDFGQWMVDAASAHAAVFPTWADIYQAANAEW